MAEADLVAAVLIELSKRNCLVWRQNSGQFWACKRSGTQIIPIRPVTCGVVGCPDVIGFCRLCGRFVSIELKFAKNTPSPEQERFNEFARQAGAIACIAWDLQTVINAHEGHRCHAS